MLEFLGVKIILYKDNVQRWCAVSQRQCFCAFVVSGFIHFTVCRFQLVKDSQFPFLSVWCVVCKREGKNTQLSFKLSWGCLGKSTKQHEIKRRFKHSLILIFLLVSLDHILVFFVFKRNALGM